MEYGEWKEKWRSIVNKAHKDYSALSMEERIWFNIRVLIDSVDNGGIISFYYNSGADYVEETIEDLKHLEAKGVLSLVKRVNRLFPGGKQSKNIDERNDVINSWEDGKYIDLLERTDKKFYELEGELEKKLELIVNKILLG